MRWKPSKSLSSRRLSTNNHISKRENKALKAEYSILGVILFLSIVILLFMIQYGDNSQYIWSVVESFPAKLALRRPFHPNAMVAETTPTISPYSNGGSQNSIDSMSTTGTTVSNSNVPSNSQISTTQPVKTDGVHEAEVAEECPKFQVKPFTLPPNHKKNGSIDMHFIHIPKCGGTSMTAILREVACIMDPSRNVDCCTNPGFCDWHAFRRCGSIKGCTNHFPQRPWIFKPVPSIALLREPSSRLLSAWFYRGHSPNLDFFQVRPEFKDIQTGKRPRVVFEEYIEMPEYQNIQTRMLGADSFPYRNVTVTQSTYCSAIEALDNIFFVGLQEEYDLSVKLLLRELNIDTHIAPTKERDQNNNKIRTQKEALRSNAQLMDRVRQVNAFDIKLYQRAVQRFCALVKKYPDLWTEFQSSKTAKQCH